MTGRNAEAVLNFFQKFRRDCGDRQVGTRATRWDPIDFRGGGAEGRAVTLLRFATRKRLLGTAPWDAVETILELVFGLLWSRMHLGAGLGPQVAGSSPAGPTRSA